MTQEETKEPLIEQLVWTDDDHQSMFVWPESPQYTTQLKAWGEMERRTAKEVSRNLDRKIARGIR